MRIGRKIYYDKATGNVITDTGESEGSVIETTTEQDFNAYQQLKERVPSSVGVIKLSFGDYSQDFAQCNGYRVDLSGATPTLVFSYPDPNAPEAPPVYRQPLSEEVATLKERDTLMQADITAIIELLGG